MCGIAGEAGSKPFIEPSQRVAVCMAQTLTHRGPDELGHFAIQDREWGVNMAMRRLSIIDREKGQQPIRVGEVILMQNGEVYNHADLRKPLVDAGHPFRSHCDTEAMAAHLRQHGIEGVQDFDGMFAIAAWFAHRRTLYLIRDRLGKKPLYYYWDEAKNLLVWGSEIKAVLAHPNVPKELRRESIYHYLCLQYCPEPDTAFAGIKCVPPGGMVTYQPREGTLEVSRWWELKPLEAMAEQGPQTLQQAVWSTVRNAVTARLESEVPLGVYLSGGIDSSIVAALSFPMKQMGELHTFAMGFEESAYNELPYARRVAEHLGTVHHEEMVRCPAMPEMARRIVEQYDQPFGDCSAIPTMLLAEASKKYITVALTGDGGDEAFGGYERYWAADPKKGIVGYAPWLCVIPPPYMEKLLDEAWYKSLNCQQTLAWLLERAITHPGQGLHNQMMWLDIHTYLLNDIIVKMERASMAASVEVRCPFLDHRVMELACAIPDNRRRFRQAGPQGSVQGRTAHRSSLAPQARVRRASQRVVSAARGQADALGYGQ
jgi:asparagine synthase (glutamine-hydrolysing)